MARKPKKSEEVKTNAADVKKAQAAVGVDAQETSVSESESENTEQDSRPSCGALLHATRIDQGLTVSDVAKQLRLSNTQIEALEEDRFSQLPEATIVKGFIRNYAKLLKVPSESFLAAYAEMAPKNEDYSFVLNPGINMKITEHKKSNRTHYFLLLIAILLGVGVWAFYQNYIQKPSPVNPIPEIVESLPELALPLSERVESALITSEQPDIAQTTRVELPAAEPEGSEGVETATQTAPVEAEQPDVALTEEGDPAVVDAAEAATEVVVDEEPGAGKTRLKFSATQETWLSVINASGKEVYNKILYAGNQEVVDIWQPSMIVVGNAHGASLIVDGKPIDLAPYTRVNVARVRLNR